MKLEQVDRKKLLPLLGELTGAVEDLLITGLTTASESTVKTLGVSFQESSRMGLLRLGATLRAVNEEVSRYTKNEPDFSRKRLSFFLNRSWVLSHAIKRAIEENHADEFERLTWTPSSTPVEKVEAVTIGVSKRVATSFCAFEFRLRATNNHGSIKSGDKLIWSCVFPTKSGSEVPAEGYLHLPQKQKFNANIFLEPKVIVIENATIAVDVTGCQRVSLTDSSTVVTTSDFTDWQSLFGWDQKRAVERIVAHVPGPFDLEVELQEEVFLNDWQVGEPYKIDDEKLLIYPIVSPTLACEAMVSSGPEQAHLRKELEKFKDAKKTPALFGLMHYERCKLAFQPLTVFEKDKPKHLMISPEKIDRAALLKTLKFV